MNAFFLAAGLGTRLRPFTETLAKPAIPFLGLPQILYPYFFTHELGIQKWAYNTHHMGDSIEAALEKFHVSAKRVHELTILNSAGGLFNARTDIDATEDFLVINSDSLFIYEDINSFKELISLHKKEERLATLVCIDKKGCGQYFPGLYSDSSHKLLAAGKIEDSPHKCSHFIGVYILSPQIFDLMDSEPKNMIYDVLLPLSQDHNIQVAIWEKTTAYELGTLKEFKLNHVELSKESFLSLDNSFGRTHQFFEKKAPEAYPYLQELERQILRSI